VRPPLLPSSSRAVLLFSSRMRHTHMCPASPGRPYGILCFFVLLLIMDSPCGATKPRFSDSPGIVFVHMGSAFCDSPFTVSGLVALHPSWQAERIVVFFRSDEVGRNSLGMRPPSRLPAPYVPGVEAPSCVNLLCRANVSPLPRDAFAFPLALLTQSARVWSADCVHPQCDRRFGPPG